MKRIGLSCIVGIVLAAQGLSAPPEVFAGGAEEDSTMSASVPTSRGRIIWSGSAFHQFARFTESRPSWQVVGANVRRRVPRQLTVDLEVGVVSRHAMEDGYAALDLYKKFGARSYGNVRFAAAPGADVMARTDIYTEFFHTPGGGWELSAGYRRADYTRVGTNTWTVGAAKYLGHWYLRVRQTVAEVRGSAGYAVLVTARRDFGAPTEYVGITVAQGREVLAFPDEDGIAARNPLSASIFFQHFLGKGAGIRVGFEGVKDGTLSRWGFITGLLWRG